MAASIGIGHHIDHLARRGATLAGHGWLLDPDRQPRRIDLQLLYADGTRFVSPCQIHCGRPDIAALFPGVRHAEHSGFLFWGRIDPDRPLAESRLQVEFADGTNLALPLECDLDKAAVPRPGGARLGTALRLIRAGDWNGIVEALRRQFGLLPPEPVTTSTVPPDFLEGLNGMRPVVIFDHDLGGGTNRYRRDLIRESVATILITYRLRDLSYELRREDAAGIRMAHLSDITALKASLSALRPARIFLNNLVSFEDPPALLDWIAQTDAALTVAVHDFFAICPSWTLIDRYGRFCGIPAPAACSECLAQAQIPFIGFLEAPDIRVWRAAWAAVLSRAEEILCFSQSSVDLMRRAFPNLDPGRIVLRPHQVAEGLSSRFDTETLNLPLTIGIIGTIDRHKGADIVVDLAALIAEKTLDIRIVVIGTLGRPVTSDHLIVTGPYETADLGRHLSDHAVNLCLFPSIWPETFSYVAEEIMKLGYPLAVFDLGAPAERVKTYERGLVLPKIDAADALERMIAFHRDRA